MTFNRKLWGIRAGLGLSYLSTAGCLFRLNLIGLVLYVLGLFMAHRILRKSDELGRIRRQLKHTEAAV